MTSGHDVADARLHREVRALLAVGLKSSCSAWATPARLPPTSLVSPPANVRRWCRERDEPWPPWRARGRVLLLLDPDTLPSALLWRAVRRRVVVADVHEDYVALLSDRSWFRRDCDRHSPPASWCVGLAGRADLTVVADDHVPPLGGRFVIGCRAEPARPGTASRTARCGGRPPPRRVRRRRAALPRDGRHGRGGRSSTGVAARPRRPDQRERAKPAGRPWSGLPSKTGCAFTAGLSRKPPGGRWRGGRGPGPARGHACVP